MLRYGVETHDVYSGVRFNKDAENIFDRTLDAFVEDFNANFPHGNMFCHRLSGDLDEDCRKLLTLSSRHHDKGESCVFGFLETTIEKAHLQQITHPAGPDLPSNPSVALEPEKIASNDHARQYICNKADDIFRFGRRVWCHCHRRRCILDFHPETHRNLHPRRLKFGGEGVSCLGWSGAGKQLLFADKSEIPHELFIQDRRQRALRHEEAWFWLECSGKGLYPVAAKGFTPLADSHTVISIRCGPQHRGQPEAGDCTFVFGLALWAGAWAGGDDAQLEFEDMFCRSMDTSVNGSIFFIGTDADTQATFRRWPAKRKIFTAKDVVLSLSDDTVCLCLSPGAILRFGSAATAAEPILN